MARAASPEYWRSEAGRARLHNACKDTMHGLVDSTLLYAVGACAPHVDMGVCAVLAGWRFTRRRISQSRDDLHQAR